LILVCVQEAFGEGHVTFNCNEDVKRLPNTCNVSLSGEGLVGYVVLSKCSHVMASTGAACHAQNKPSGNTVAFLNLCMVHPLLCYDLTFSVITHLQ
jgi:cysteine sulfinate desulfinase/cysteine desulfurase-like protein